MTDPIRPALEGWLAALDDFPTAYQNAAFVPPADGSPYQEVFILYAKPMTVGLRQRTALNSGIFQVNLCYPDGEGAGRAESRAKAIADHFDPSTTVIDAGGGQKIRVKGRAVLGAPLPGRPGRYVVPVSVRFEFVN